MKLIEIEIIYAEFNKPFIDIINEYIRTNYLFKGKSKDDQYFYILDYKIPNPLRGSVPYVDNLKGTIFIEAELAEYNEGDILEDAVLDVIQKKVVHKRIINENDVNSQPHLVCNVILPERTLFDEYLLINNRKYMHNEKVKVRIEVLYRIDDMIYYEGEVIILEK